MREIDILRQMETCSTGKTAWLSFLLLALVLSLLVPFHSARSAGTESCITCHTDDQKMKSIVKPPEIGGEGEG